jgi:hypothetical protein
MSQNVESRSNGSVESLTEPAESCSSHLQYKQNVYIKLWKKSLNSDGKYNKYNWFNPNTFLSLFQASQDMDFQQLMSWSFIVFSELR